MNAGWQPETLFEEIEIDESPSMPREDFAPINYVCDENGLIEKAPGELERRGVTSHAELWSKTQIHAQSVVAKLRSIGRDDLAQKLADCHTEETCRVCTGCKRVTVFFNRCERHYCPQCQPRLSRERRESVEWWTREIAEPKHVVLTARNSDTLTKDYMKWLKQSLGRLRRLKFARNWKGGFYRMEITNEGKGWHVHFHLLVNAGWIDGGQLAKAWAKCVEQDIAIVKVKDVHSREYLAEVTKYTVKGSQLAGWSAEQIATFIDALDGVRTFGVFGDLYGKRTEYREWIQSIQNVKPLCACGCDSFRLMNDLEAEWYLLRESTKTTCATRPPPLDTPDLLNLPLVEGRPPMPVFYH